MRQQRLTRTLQVRIAPHTLADLAEWAESEELDVSQLARMVIKRAIRHWRKKQEAQAA